MIKYLKEHNFWPLKGKDYLNLCEKLGNDAVPVMITVDKNNKEFAFYVRGNPKTYFLFNYVYDRLFKNVPKKPNLKKGN